MVKIALYECMKCLFRWPQKQSSSEGYYKDAEGYNLAYQPNPPPSKCPSCSHLYLKWLNYEEFAL